MSTELIPHTGEKAIVMRSGMVRWIAADRAEKMEAMLASENPPRFLSIDGAMLATSEIESVLTTEGFVDYERVKQGMWQCSYGNWHNKGKHECECSKEHYKRQRELARQREAEEQNRPLTAEQKAERDASIKSIGEYFRERGMGRGSKVATGAFLKRSALMDYERRHGQPYNVPAGTRVDEDLPDFIPT